ncbi:MAG: pentapeptide repeat-containing protein [Pirellulales bacterium]
MPQPKFLDDPTFKALRLGDFAGFNREAAGKKVLDYSDTDLRGVDFRGVTEVNKLVVRGAYMRDADLRGLDLRNWDMEGCSLYHAKVSGAFFPANISAQEIITSVELGTRMRASK